MSCLALASAPRPLTVLHDEDTTSHAFSPGAMRSPTSGRRTAMRLLAVSLIVAHIATAAAVDMIQSPLQLSSTAPSPRPIAHAHVDHASQPLRIVSIGNAVLDRLGRLLGALFPNFPDESQIGNEGGGDGGLFGDGDGSLAWGGSTLEVVKTQASYLTRPATFGPRIVEEDGLRGSLLPISDFYKPPTNKTTTTQSDTPDNHGCPYRGGPGWREDEEKGGNEGNTMAAFAAPKPSPPKNWIALVERGGKCSFVSKVRVAQALGAKAVVVGDAPSPEHEHDGPLDNDPGLSGRLVTMFAPGDTSDVLIPSTFIKRPSYVDLIRLVAETEKEEKQECVARHKEGKPCDKAHGGVQVILWREDVMWEWPLIDLAFVLLMLPSFMTLITIVVHRVRMIQQRRKERAPEEAVLNLPCLIWRPPGQPWEKVEDATIAGGGASTPDGQAEQSWHMKRFAHVGKFLGRLRRRSQDMELGDQVDAAAVATDDNVVTDADASNEAGPSTAVLKLKTTPVAPPQSTPERTYYGCDECAICLSEFVDGELVRVLPCGHVFHLPEIDSWLCKVKKLCPVCKRDITVPVPPNPFTQPAVAATTTPVEESAAAAAATANAVDASSDDENTPLLGGRLV